MNHTLSYVVVVVIIIETYVISLQFYEFFRKSLNVWLLTLCWSHAKIISKTKKCLSIWTLNWYEYRTCVSVRYMSDTEHLIDEVCPGFIVRCSWSQFRIGNYVFVLPQIRGVPLAGFWYLRCALSKDSPQVDHIMIA